jgi:amidase
MKSLACVGTVLVTIFPHPGFGHTRPAAAQPRAVVYHASNENVQYVYGPAAPVARLDPGDYLETNTLDAFGDALQKPGDTLRLVKRNNPLTGPFYIEHAEPGDTLVIQIVALEVVGSQGVGVLAPRFGGLNSTAYAPMLNPAPSERIWFYPIDHRSGRATFRAHDSNFSTEIPLHFFLGCIGVAPSGSEMRSSNVPAEFGGKMDAPEVSVGNTLYLPVNVQGALLYLGCGHAAMGDGEVGGTAIEVPLSANLRTNLIKGKQIAWPRLESQHEIMTVGICRPVDDALRIAFHEMIEWIHEDYHLSELDAFELLSKIAHVRLVEMVNPSYVVILHVQKKYLTRGKD